MNKTGKYIAYLFFSLFTFLAFMASCTAENEPEKLISPGDKISLSISFHSAQQTKTQNGLRANEGGEIGEDVFARESKIYSLAVLIFENSGDKLAGYKFIDRTIKTDGLGDKDYNLLTEIKEITLTAGKRDVYIIANAPDKTFSRDETRTSFQEKLESLANQKVYAPGVQANEEESPIGGVEPAVTHTNLVMSQSFPGLDLTGAKKHYLGYGSNEHSDGITLTDPVKLVRLVARVAIQKISFALPTEVAFESGIKTQKYNHYIDTVFLINAKTASSYFPRETNFPVVTAPFGHGSYWWYKFFKDNKLTAPDAQFADYLSIPINFSSYDIENNQVPLWFYTFENSDSETYPTAFIIGVKYQYINPGESVVKVKKAYYPVVINSNGGGPEDNKHRYIKRNNQYGLKVTIKGVGNLIAGYITKSALSRMTDILSAQEESGVLEVEETVGSNLFPWGGDVYK
ncbi:MAG TPA: hypothetical protein DDW85_10300 [Porphyromonadaceae bacterium]|nr:hypothetical protein [Porphyromonadaceae bacterium]